MKKIYIILIGFMFFMTNAKAQNLLSLYHLENIPQSVIVNPAMTPRANLYIGIPLLNSMHLGLTSDIPVSSLIQSKGGENYTITDARYDYLPLYLKMGRAANFNMALEVAPIVFGFRVNETDYFTFSWREKLNVGIAVPRDLFKIMERGLPDGTNLDLSPLSANVNYYREFSFGYSTELTKKLRLGANVKLLQGIVAGKTNLNKFEVNTSKDEWNLALDGEVYATDSIKALENMLNGGGIVDKAVLNFDNLGGAIDLGAVYELNEKWTFSGSVIDLGFIRWKGDSTYTAKGSFAYTGLDVSGGFSSATGDLVDSLKKSVSLKKGAPANFTTVLSPKVFLATKYKVNHYFSLGALSRTTIEKNNIRQEVNVSTNINLYKVLTTSFNYNINFTGANALGLGLGLRFGILQFYFAADYLPHTIYKNITFENVAEVDYLPANINSVNFSMGLNLVFGANGNKDKPVYNTRRQL